MKDKEYDFAEAKIKLHTSQFNIDTGKNDITSYELYFLRQTTYKNSMWFCLIERDKEGANVMQLDFNDIPKKTIKKMIKILDADMSTK